MKKVHLIIDPRVIQYTAVKILKVLRTDQPNEENIEALREKIYVGAKILLFNNINRGPLSPSDIQPLIEDLAHNVFMTVCALWHE